jgi:hypothetical protein
MDNVPTTLEMDKLLTGKDIADRFHVMKPCTLCFQFSKQDVRITDSTCSYCKGELGKHSSLWYSIRTFNISKKLTAADKKKMGL